MRKIKKTIITLVTGLAVFSTFTAPASAAAATPSIAVPYADEIQLKLRTYNGVLQYRHWNATRNRWVESHWINY